MVAIKTLLSVNWLEHVVKHIGPGINDGDVSRKVLGHDILVTSTSWIHREAIAWPELTLKSG
jgi:hypothetical protein